MNALQLEHGQHGQRGQHGLEAALAGAVSLAPLSPGYVAAANLQFSRRGRCRPFAADADGIVVGLLNFLGIIFKGYFVVGYFHAISIYRILECYAYLYDVLSLFPVLACSKDKRYILYMFVLFCCILLFFVRKGPQ